jgi:hypothetical protein
MKQIFNESGTGQPSSTRVIFVIGIAYAMIFTALYTFLSDPFPEVASIIALFTAMTGIFIGLKLGQKPMEGKK